MHSKFIFNAGANILWLREMDLADQKDKECINKQPRISEKIWTNQMKRKKP